MPDPIPGVTSLKYGDFDIYSLAFLNYIAGAGTPQPGDPFYVPTSPGQIGPTNGDLIIATFPNGNKNNAAPLAADNAWGVPSGGGSANIDWYTFPVTAGAVNSVDAPDPSGGPVVGDMNGTWDATGQIINDRVDVMGDKTLFFFNLNETGTLSQLDGQDLQIYVNMDVRMPDGTLVQSFEVSGDNSPVGPTNSDGVPGGAAVGPDNRTNWAYVHSEITVGVDKITGERSFIHLGPPDGRPEEANFDDVQALDQNLGADNAAFAAFNQELHDLLRNNPTYILSVSMELANINNGYEQVFIQGGMIGGRVAVIPEPSSIAIWSLVGCVGLANRRRKKVKASA